jgi:hypothetical protein
MPEFRLIEIRSAFFDLFFFPRRLTGQARMTALTRRFIVTLNPSVRRAKALILIRINQDRDQIWSCEGSSTRQRPTLVLIPNRSMICKSIKVDRLPHALLSGELVPM